MTWLAFVLTFFLFISFPSRFWNFDGVACAAALELGNPKFLFHSNHLLYGFFGFLFWKGLSPLGMGRALPALQLFTSLIAAGGLTGLYRLLARGLEKPLALLATLSVAATAVVWQWSIEAQVYALGFLAIAWASYVLWEPECPGKWVRVGALHAGAILGHIVHVLWIVPALYLLRKQTRGRAGALRSYFLSLMLCAGVPYLLVIGPMASLDVHDGWLMRWLLGSTALNAQSTFQWHLAGWSGPLQWASTSLRLFWGSFWPYHTTVSAWSWLLTALSMAGVAVLLFLGLKKGDKVRRNFCLLWLAAYGVFFWTWEPTTECYRMTDLIPLALLLAMGLNAVRKSAYRRTLIGALCVALFAVNLRTRIAPMTDTRNNPVYQEVQQLAALTPEQSIYLTAGGNPWIYLIYFGGRSTWNIHSLSRDPTRMRDELARQKTQHAIYIREDALRSEAAKPLLERWKARPVATLVSWYQLQ